jgi:hypothetical protein
VQNVTLVLNPSGQLQFYQDGGYYPSGNTTVSVPIGSASGDSVIVPNTYYFIELYITPATAGFLQCRVNGVTVIAYSGSALKTNPWTTTMFLGAAEASGCQSSFDDWYMLDLSGPGPLQTYLGPGRVQTDGPSGESATPGLNVWTATNPTGSDYGNCANIPANSAEYNASGTIGQRMSLSFPALSYVQCVFLNTWISAEEDAAGVRGITPIFRSNDVDQAGTAINLAASYTYYSQASAIDPNTSEPWADGTVTAAQNCEIGVEVTT